MTPLLRNHELVPGQAPAVDATDVRRRRLEASGQALAYAILVRAVIDVKFPRSSRGHTAGYVHDSAQRWFLSSDRSYIFSFVNVCDLLGFSSDTLRRRILEGRSPRTSAQALRQARLR